MAALSIGHSFYKQFPSIQKLRSRRSPRNLILLSHQTQEQEPEDSSSSSSFSSSTTKRGKKTRKQQQSKPNFFVGFEKIGKGLKDNISPQKKGDWKDITLMSLSFAVYVYISQQLVCAYCTWISMAHQQW